MKTAITTTALALFLTGCVIPVDPQQAGDPPEDFQKVALESIKTLYLDPYSMRDVGISAPVLGRILGTPGWLICIRANAKNAFGAYTGIRYSGILYRRGRIVQSEADIPYCAGANFVSLPDRKL